MYPRSPTTQLKCHFRLFSPGVERVYPGPACFIDKYCTDASGSERAVVVLHDEGGGADGYGLDGATQEVLADHMAACYSSCDGAQQLLVADHLHAWWSL